MPEKLFFHTQTVTNWWLQNQRIRTKGFSFADKSPGTDPTYAALVMPITVLQCSW